MVHSDPDAFDDFYKDARNRLLLQTYALTGDLPASRSAVRDSFVVAWHHWRKVSRLETPESSVRPRAWAQAQRRHTTRLWHRDKGLDAADRATFDALGELSTTRRKLLVLDQVAHVPMAEIAREVSLPRKEAERELRIATTEYAAHRDIPLAGIRATFDSLDAHVAGTRWPRPTILRRAGAARRRTHTSVGAVAVVAALLVSGSVVGASGDVPGTPGEGSGSVTQDDAAVSAGLVPGSAPAARPAAPAVELRTADLLSADQVRRLAPGRTWLAGATGDNTEGDGLVVPCQQEPFADPDGTSAAVRRFRATPERGAPGVRAAQLSELSGDVASARQAYRRALGWYAGCREPRTQLVDTHALPGVGDQAQMFVLRSWDRPVTTATVAIARSGRFTTTLVRTVADGTRPELEPVASALAAAVNSTCGDPGTGACAAPPRVRPAAPLRAGAVPMMVSEFDLPRVLGVDAPWVGTDPVPARVNVAATRCDEASFADLGGNRTRTFVVPGARLPAAFGLTETVGTFPRAAGARGFVEEIRSRVAACPDEEMGSEVELLEQRGTGATDLSVWRVTVEISDEESVRYLMAVLRQGRAVAQLGFVPSGDKRIALEDFVDLADRALDRLAAPPGRSGS